MTGRLTPVQARAMTAVTAALQPEALVRRAEAHLRRWARCGPASGSPFDRLCTINFHPDRRAHGGLTVLDSILGTGLLQNQFESNLTNGFPLDHNGGLRARREHELFAGAYDSAPPVERPKYGSVNLVGNPRGGWPRFGSCHWRLDPGVLDRSTVTVPGSPSTRAWSGLADGLAKLLLAVDQDPAAAGDGHRYRAIDGCVELQVHGRIELGRDVVGLVLDPSFRGSPVESSARLVCSAFDVELGWSPDLRSDPAGWRTPAWRRWAGARVRSAAEAGTPVTASWIGQDLWAERTDPEEAEIVDGTGRYLWNRLLLTQDRPSGRTGQVLGQLEADGPLAVVDGEAGLPHLLAVGAE